MSNIVLLLRCLIDREQNSFDIISQIGNCKHQKEFNSYIPFVSFVHSQPILDSCNLNHPGVQKVFSNPISLMR